MAAFGTGVNPALGRIDYTPYLQGSVQGSAAIGQGIANLGQGIGAAIKEYSQNKEMRDLLTQNNETQAQKALAISEAFKKNPQLFGNVQPFSDKTLQDLKNMPNMSMGKLKALNADLNASVTKYEPIIAEYENQAREAQAYRAATSSVVPPQNAVSAYIAAGGRSPQQFAKTQADIENQRAQSLLYRAQAGSAGQPKEKDMSQYDTVYSNMVNAWSAENDGKTPTPQVLADIARRASETVSGKAVGQEMQAQIIPFYLKQGENYAENAKAASDAIPGMEKTIEILSGNKDLTGFGAELKNNVRSIAKSFGFPVDEEALKNTQVLQATLGEGLLNVIRRTKGATSDKEMAAFQTMAGSIGKDPAALKDVVNLAYTVSKQNIEINRAFTDTLNRTRDVFQASEAAQNLRNKFDNEYLKKIDDINSKGYGLGGGQGVRGPLTPSPTPSSGVRIYNPATGTLSQPQ